MAFEREIPCDTCGETFTQTRDYMDVEFPDDVEPMGRDDHGGWVECKMCVKWRVRPRAGFVAAKERWRAV